MDGAIQKALGDKADYYLGFARPRSPRIAFTFPGGFRGQDCSRLRPQQSRPDESGAALQDRTPVGNGLPVDAPGRSGVEHSAGASFAKNPDYFDPENIVKLAIDGVATRSRRRTGCSAWSRAGTRTRFRSS